MNKFYLILLFLSVSVHTIAKEPSVVRVFKNREYLAAESFDLTEARILGTTVFVARYTFSYQKEGWNKLSWGDGEFTLQVGHTWTKFYPDLLLEIDSIRTKMHDALFTPATVYPRIWTVYSDGEGNVTSEHRIPFSDDFLVRYPEFIDSTVWSLTGATAEILGYNCQQATARFRGRSWEVWFTPEIPVTANLWTFRGLPGLILKAGTDMFKFNCKSLQHARQPIVKLAARCKEFTRDKWRKFEKEYHEHPYELFNENGTVAFFDERSELNRDNWTIEYNPPELE